MVYFRFHPGNSLLITFILAMCETYKYCALYLQWCIIVLAVIHSRGLSLAITEANAVLEGRTKSRLAQCYFL